MLQGGIQSFEVVLTWELEFLAILKVGGGGGGVAGWRGCIQFPSFERGVGWGWGGGAKGYTLSKDGVGWKKFLSCNFPILYPPPPL